WKATDVCWLPPLQFASRASRHPGEISRFTQSRNRSAPARMDLACRAIELSRLPGAGPDAMLVIRWDIGANLHQRMGFTKALCIRTRVPMAVFDCTAKPRHSFRRR